MDSTHQPTVLAGAPPSSPHGSSSVSLITHQPQHTVLAVAPEAEAPSSSPHGPSTVSLTTAPTSITQQPQHSVLAVAPDAEAPPPSPHGSSTVILIPALSSMTQQPVLAVASQAKAPPSLPHSSSTVARIAAPPSSSKLAGTMAVSWFAIVASVVAAIIWAAPLILLQMDGELPFYITTLMGLFVAASVVWAGWSYPKSHSYRFFMLIYVYIGTTAVWFTCTETLMLMEFPNLQLEWLYFGLLTVLGFACSFHDYLQVHAQFKVGLSLYVALLMTHWARRCGKAYGEAWVFYIPSLTVGTAILLIEG